MKTPQHHSTTHTSKVFSTVTILIAKVWAKPSHLDHRPTYSFLLMNKGVLQHYVACLHAYMYAATWHRMLVEWFLGLQPATPAVKPQLLWSIKCSGSACPYLRPQCTVVYIVRQIVQHTASFPCLACSTQHAPHVSCSTSNTGRCVADKHMSGALPKQKP